MNLRPSNLNVGPNKQYLDDLADHAEVYLDGVMKEKVREADTDNGYIIQDVYKNGKLVIKYGDVKQQTLKGKVQIKDRRTGRYVA